MASSNLLYDLHLERTDLVIHHAERLRAAGIEPSVRILCDSSDNVLAKTIKRDTKQS